MAQHRWMDEIDVAVTVCDKDGTILEMNEKSVRTYQKDGGKALIGSSLLNCHPEPARSRLKQLLGEGQLNAYTIEKHGVKKLIYQIPWTEGGEYRGFVELSLPMPAVVPHFVRK